MTTMDDKNKLGKNEVMAMMSWGMTDNFGINTALAAGGGTGFNVTATSGAGPSTSTSLAYSVTADNSAGYSLGSVSGGAGLAHTVYHGPVTGWDYYQNYYYPLVIRESYPVYLQERAVDKGKQAFEILKLLQDKKLLTIEKVSDFIEAMDSLIKVL